MGGFEELITDDILEPGDVDAMMSNPKRGAEEAGLAETPLYNEEVPRLVYGPDAPDEIEEIDDEEGAIVAFNPIRTTQRADWSRDMVPEYRRMQYQAQRRGDIRAFNIAKRKADVIEARKAILARNRAEEAWVRSLRAETALADQAIAVMDVDAVGPPEISNFVVDGPLQQLTSTLTDLARDEVQDLSERFTSAFQPYRRRRVDGGTGVGVYTVEDVDREVRRIQGGRNWGGVSGRRWIGNIPNAITNGTTDVYQGAAVSSGVNIPGVNMERPTPQPAQPATYGAETADDGPPVEVLDIIQQYAGHGQDDTFFGKSVRVASDWQKEAAMRNFMGSDFIEKPGLYANM